MKLTATRNDLVAALRPAVGATNAASTMPILACVAMRVDGKNLSITGTDLTVTVTTTCAVTDSAKGVICTPAKALLEIVGDVKGDEPIAISDDGNGWIEVKVGKKIRARAPTMNAQDFPKVPQSVDASWQSVDAPSFRGALAIVAPSVCHDETRFHLNGACVDGTMLVSTDGHRLHVAPCPPTIGKGIIPERAIVEVMRALDGIETCDVVTDGLMMFLRAGIADLAVKLIDAQFPPWRQVLAPRTGTGRRSAKVDRVALIGALKRAARYETVSGVKFALSTGLIISGQNGDRGEYVEDLDLLDGWDGAPFVVGINPKYAIAACEIHSSEYVEVSFGSELDPVCVFAAGSDASATIMPTRIG